VVAVPTDGGLTEVRWNVSTRRGPAEVLHANLCEFAGRRMATWCEVDRPSLVLGSSQPESSVDLEACRDAGVDVVRRHSGGGAVLIVPGEMLWLDVVVPSGDPLWSEDVGRAMWWLGEVWAEALEACGVAAPEVYRGPLRQTAWSRLVCFDSLGAGEVLVGGVKAVGISQRRTRSWARLQSSVHLAWRPELMTSLLASPRPEPTELLHPYVVSVGADQLSAAIADRLAVRSTLTA
jgi:lipoate-protein ligase A